MDREEAIKKVRQMSLPKETMEILEALAPELKESEDERIRKKLYHTVMGTPNDSTWFDGTSKEAMLAYLEKQKEQNQKITVKVPKFRVGDIIQHVPLESWDRTRKIFAIDEDGYYVDTLHLGDIASGGFIGFSFEDEYELVEQKPAEKPSMLELLREHLANTPKEQLDAEFEALKEFTIPKSTEWSEEDEDMLNSCISSIEEAKENRYAYKETDGDTSYDHEIAWLKSLRPVSKESLQSHWKPSEQ